MHTQPVVGMRSCLDYLEHGGSMHSWRAREWFHVRRADVHFTEDDVLVPSVEMGVDAREQVWGMDDRLEDVPLTKNDHPLVKYALSFTENFCLIAERKSVIY